jgi:hypothetical protein
MKLSISIIRFHTVTVTPVSIIQVSVIALFSSFDNSIAAYLADSPDINIETERIKTSQTEIKGKCSSEERFS